MAPPSDAAAGGDAGTGGTSGRRVVLLIYAASILTAAVFGAVLGLVLDSANGPSVGSFGSVTFPLTPLNLALFGMLTVGFLLTVGLLLVRIATERSA